MRIIKNTSSPDEQMVKQVLKKASEKKGLALNDVGVLVNFTDKRLMRNLFDVAAKIKKEIYGSRLVFFAPIYVSDFCVNDCEYCNFHLRNKDIARKKLTMKEIAEQTKILLGMGHKRLLLESGESNVCSIDYIVKAIKTIYSVRLGKNKIRRINVNIAATTIENYRKLKKAGIGTYQLFQETYHPETYAKLHRGPKSDYERQITAHDRAFAAGIDDVGLGVLFGLYDWRFEVLALVAHAQYLEKKFGVGPHTISVPRFRPAPSVSYEPKYPVGDDDFLKIIAILRLAVPYTGLIISTREKPEIRRKAFRIGISQASAASVPSVGGYSRKNSAPQFTTSDERTLPEVINAVVKEGLLPSFCTACYRRGRTGERFMDLAKPAEIHNFCLPNGLLTFAEFLEDFASPSAYKIGQKIIKSQLKLINNPEIYKKTKSSLEKIKHGARDLYF